MKITAGAAGAIVATRPAGSIIATGTVAVRTARTVVAAGTAGTIVTIRPLGAGWLDLGTTGTLPAARALPSRLTTTRTLAARLAAAGSLAAGLTPGTSPAILCGREIGQDQHNCGGKQHEALHRSTPIAMDSYAGVTFVPAYRSVSRGISSTKLHGRWRLSS